MNVERLPSRREARAENGAAEPEAPRPLTARVPVDIRSAGSPDIVAHATVSYALPAT